MKRLKFSDGILLAAVPAAGYLVAYMYEFGYCRYFNIPYDFISIDRQVIVSSCLAVLGLFAAFHSVIDFIRENFAWMPPPLGRVLVRIFMAIAIGLGLSVVSRATYLQMFTTCAIFAGPAVIGNLLLPLIPDGSSGSYIGRVAFQLAKEDARESMLDLYAKAAGANVALGVALFYLVCLSAYVIGGYSAKDKVRFLTVLGSSEVVLIRSNSGFLVASYDAERGTIKADVRLIPMDSKLQIADIGPLVSALPSDPRKK